MSKQEEQPKTVNTVPLMKSVLAGPEGRDFARKLLDKYFKTTENFLTRHNIDSFDQFLKTDLLNIIKSSNPFLLIKDLSLDEQKAGDEDNFVYVKIFVGGENGDKIKIGVPTLTLQNNTEIRALLPNEARIRNLTYESTVLADILIRVEFGVGVQGFQENEERVLEYTLENHPLFSIPILLHSRYCLLHGKNAEFLHEAGECIYDQGGYFIVDGSEKVLITVQEQAFNTLYVKRELNATTSPQVHTYASVLCLSPQTRLIKRISFQYLRKEKTIRVGLPFLRLPIPLFILFRALGLTSDKEIMRTIFPDENAEDAQLLQPLLIPSMIEAYPFVDTFSAMNYMKTLTKGFSIEHILDILNNQTFIHVANRPLARAHYLAECVRQILRNVVDIDPDTDRDDTRNQRALPAGFMVQQLFQGIYKSWKTSVIRAIEYKYNPHKTDVYTQKNFSKLFIQANLNEYFRPNQITSMIRRGFKGKWGGSYGEEKDGALQALSRLSYLDFLSHCRRVVLNFDTSMKLQPPRRLHGSQFGYFCTSETPGGASIGITKNLSLLTSISISSDPEPLEKWLFERGEVYQCNEVPMDSLAGFVPIYINGGIIGYTESPELLTEVLKLFKWTGCLPAYTSIGFSYRERRIFIYLDDGRPTRPLIRLKNHQIPLDELNKLLQTPNTEWRHFVQGTNDIKKDLSEQGFTDPLAAEHMPSLERYKTYLTKSLIPGVIEYIDPYEQNEAYIASFPDHITGGTTFSHLEVHPSTIVSILTGQIPFANHNQSPRNQLSCSQSKQALSLYATNFQNRFDNTANILCYGQAPLSRTIYYDYIADGNMPYGYNAIIAIGCYSGYNRDDGILFNADAFQRGLFRSINYRSYEAVEEKDDQAGTSTLISHPKDKINWFNLSPGLDYSKLDNNGVIRVGEIVDENTVLVSRYIETRDGDVKDASVTPQVWTSGRVESIVVVKNNEGLRTIRVRITHDRIPELGDKFSNRHGQKGTIGMMLRAHDMPRTASGLVPDLIMNPHAIPSRMTIAQLLEMIFGKLGAAVGSIGNATMFMNDGDPSIGIGKQLQSYGFEKQGNELLYNGQTGTMMPSEIFVGPVYYMRLKHMVADKWNARGLGRRERRTHQPTGGRGNQGGLRIGELERDTMIAHGISSFIRESYMKRSDGTEMIVCNGCGQVPIYNESQNLYICSLCDGPVQFAGNEIERNFTILPPSKRSYNTFSRIEIPYVLQLLNNELQTYANMGMRYVTSKYGTKFVLPSDIQISNEEALKRVRAPLPQFEFKEPEEVTEEDKETEKDDDQPPVLPLDAIEEGNVEGQQGQETKVEIPQNATVLVVPSGTTINADKPVTQVKNVTQMTTVVPEKKEEPESAPVPAPIPAPAPTPVLEQQQQQQQQVPEQKQIIGTMTTTMNVPVQQTVPIVGYPQGNQLLSQVPESVNQSPTSVATSISGLPTPPSQPLQGLTQALQQPYLQQQASAPAILNQPLQPQMGGAMLYTSGIPQLPPTFVVDTTLPAMAMEGLMPNAPVARPRSPNRHQQQQQQQNQQQSPNVKINIIKQGAS